MTSAKTPPRVQRRHALAQALEPRLLLAGDAGPALMSTALAEGESGQVQIDGFGSSLREALTEISRVVGSIGQSPTFDQAIPFLGDALPVDVGGTSIIDTDTVGSLFSLPERFEQAVAGPLRSYLDTHPTATAPQLINQFDFLEAVDGLSAGIQAVRLNLDFSETLQKPLESLLRPLTQFGGPFQVPTGDALAELLQVEISTEDLDFQVLVDTQDNVKVEVPNFSLSLGNADLGSANIAGRIGVLAGAILNPEVDLDLGWRFDAGELFGGGLGSTDAPGLSTLRSIGGQQIAEGFDVQTFGTGLALNLPFNFVLPGFDAGGRLPQLVATDSNPIDDVFPAFDILVPEGAPYDLESILGFGELSPTTMLALLEDLGDVFRQIQNGSILDVPIPFTGDVTVGEALGLAEGYAAGVLNFIKTGEGLPDFDSIQELIDLIPGIPDAPMGPQLPAPVTYNPESKTLDISLDFVRDPDPIHLQADLNVFAGQADRPFAQLLMDDVNPDTGQPDNTLNRVQITRNASLGLDLQIDLSLQKDESIRRELVAIDHSLDYRVTPWTRLDEFARRFGFADEFGLEAVADVTLRDGTTGILNFGVLDPSRTIGDLIDRAKIVGSSTIGGADVLPTRASVYVQLQDDFLNIVDHSDFSGVTTIVPRKTPDTAHLFWDNLFGNNEVAPNRLESSDGVVPSRLLRGSFLDGHLTPTGGGQTETPLRWLFPVAGPDAGLMQDIQPLVAHLRDGRDVTLTLTDLDTETIEALLPRLSADIDGVPVLRAEIEDERIVIRDLTDGGGRFRIQWAEQAGWSILSQIVDVGRDQDRDGKLIGPRLLPPLTNDLRPAVDEDTRMVDLAAQYGIDPTRADSLTVQFRNGASQTINSASYTATETLGDFIEFFNDDNDDASLSLNDGKLRLFDLTEGSDGVLTFLTTEVGGLFEKLFPEPFNIDFDFDRVIRSRTLTTSGVSLTTPVLDLVPPGIDLRNAGTVEVRLRNGQSYPLPPIDLAGDASVGDLSAQWSVFDAGQQVLAARLLDGRIVLQDLSRAEDGNTFRVHVSGAATVEGAFLADQRDDDGDGLIAGPLLNRPIAAIENAPVIHSHHPPVPAWTRIHTLIERWDAEAFTDGIESMRVQLRDGTEVTFQADSDSTQTLADLTHQSRKYRGGELIAELVLDDDRLVLVDRTTGSGPIVLTEHGQAGVFFREAFTPAVRSEMTDRWVSRPLGHTILGSQGGRVPLTAFVDDPFHPMFGTPNDPVFVSQIEYTLRDGSNHQTGLFVPTRATLQEYLERLTVRDGGRVLVQPKVVDGRIVLLDQTEGDGTFHAVAMQGAADQLHRRFLGLGHDIDGNGELVGPSLLPTLPSVIDPVRDTMTVKRLLDSVAGAGVAQQAITSQATANLQLRDGTTPALSLGPLGETATIADLLSQLRIDREGEGVVFEVALADGRLVAIDHTTGGADFLIDDADFSTNNLFSAIGLTGTVTDIDGNALSLDVDNDGVIEGSPLYASADPVFLSIGSLQSGDISVANSTVTLKLRDGTTEIVSVGAITATDDLLAVIERLNVQRDGETIVAASYRNGRVVLEDLTVETGDHVFQVDFGNTNFSYPTNLFLPLSKDLDDDGRIVGPSLVESVPTAATGPDTLLAELAPRFGLPPVSDVEDVVVEITLRNGTQITQPLAVHPGMTLREFLSQMEVSEVTPDGDRLLFMADLVNINGTAESSESPRWRIVLRDFTDNVDGSGETVIRRLEQQENFGSMLPTFLGIYGRDQNNTGVIVGGSLELGDDNERVRIKLTEPPNLTASIAAIATNVTADARIGGLASASIRNGQGLAAASVSLQVNPPIGKDYVTTADLIGAITGRNGLLDVQLDTDLQFGGELALDLGGLNEQFSDPAEIPRVDMVWPDFLTNDPSLQVQFDTLDVQFTNAENLFKLKDLTLEDITQLIRRVVDLVERISGDELLYRPLPLVDTSIGEVLDAVDFVDAIVQQTIEDPDASLKTLETSIENTLGLNDDQLALSYDAVNNAIKIELDLSIAPDAFTSSLNLDLSDVGLSGLDSLVDFQATGTIDVTADAELNLDLGINLDALGVQRLREEADRQNPDLPPTADFDSVVLVYGTSGVVATARAAATNLAFDTVVGPLAVSVGPGAAVLDADGLAFGGTATNDPAMLTIGLPDETAVYELTALSPDDFEFDFSVSAGVDLPLTFEGLTGTTTEALQLKWNNIDPSQTPSFQSVDMIDPAGGNQIVLPALDIAAGDFDATDGVFALVAGLEGLFNLVEGYLGDEILGIPVPVIGDGLSAATGFLADLRSELTGSIDTPGLSREVARQLIFDALGPVGLNVIQDAGGPDGIADGVLDRFDVICNCQPEDPGGPEGEMNHEIFYRLQLGGSFRPVDSALSLDVGVPALGLELDGGLSLDVGWSLDVGFGINPTEGVFVEFFGDDEIKLGFKAAINQLTAAGRLGPVSLSASTIAAEDLTEQQRLSSRLDADQPLSEAINALRGRYGIDLGEGRVSLTTLPGYLSSLSIDTQAELAGSLHLDVLTGLDTDARMPALATQLHVTWPSVQGNLLDAISSLAQPEIEFTDVALDLGSFVSDIIGPSLQQVNEMIEPLRPILDALTAPIPVISDLAGETTFVDLMGLFGSGGETVGEFVDAAATIASLINVPVVSGNVRIPLGDFATAFSGGEGENGGGLMIMDPVGGENYEDFVNDLPADDEVGGWLRRLPDELSIPILEQPTSAIQFLLGGDVTLIEYDIPRLEASFSYSQYFPIWPIFGFTVGGELSIAADFAFGYDTFGIRQFADSRRVQDLFNGFFLSDRIVTDPNGNQVDLPEVEFEAALLAGGELNLLLASAGVEGGLFAGIDLNLNDPNSDGKIRAGELIDNLSLGRHPLLGPLWIFDASGQLEVGLRAYVEAVGLREEVDLGRITLLDFNIPRPQPGADDPQLATLQDDGTLLIHAGPNAAFREYGDTSDGDEEFLIESGSTGVKVSAFGVDATYEDVQRIHVDLGQGDDTLTIGDNLSIPTEVIGGAGNDRITGGGGTLIVSAGPGDDLIIGSIAGDLIDGGAGNDEIQGELGDDTLIGGSGDDIVRGGAGIDRIDAGDGEDRAYGGLGSDFIVGGLGNDIIDGQEGDDVIFGDTEGNVDTPELAPEFIADGDDVLLGGLGSDLIVGGGGHDQLTGGAHGDQLFGGGGNDVLIAATSPPTNNSVASHPQSLLLGGDTDDYEPHTLNAGLGDDLVFGSAGNDLVLAAGGMNIIRTYSGDDIVTTGGGDDVIITGLGNDRINAGDGHNAVRTGAGMDIVTSGIGNDRIDLRGRGAGQDVGGSVTDAGGDNRIFGDAGDDVFMLAGGNNYVDAGDGNNNVTTGSGDDVIVTGGGNDLVTVIGGDNDITTGGGDDGVTSGGGRDHIDAGGGNNTVDSGAGNDVVLVGSGDDIVYSGGGDDFINAGNGNNQVVAGRGSDTVLTGDGQDVVWGGLELFTNGELKGSLVVPDEFALHGAYAGFVAPAIVPRVVGGSSTGGAIDDGDDILRTGAGSDIVFGGGGNDDVDGGDGPGYLDGGLGDDRVQGGSGADVIRGGEGDDTVRGGAGIDLLFGDAGEDDLQGQAGDANAPGGHQTFGQMLFGGPGNDTLSAWAASTDVSIEASFDGDRLDGGAGIDVLRGNLRREVILGGLGDDTLSGDRLQGDYGLRTGDDPLLSGADDTLLGGPGDDQIFGHGGNDLMWGGSGTDIIEGHAGIDTSYGGTGIDFLYLDVDSRYRTTFNETIDGFYGNSSDADVADDNATDILVIPGTPGNDTITVGGQADQLVVDYNGFVLRPTFRDEDGNPTIQQFQIDALGGDDRIEFLPSMDLGDLTERSRDWVAVINGGSGDDTLLGSDGRDRLSGGPGSDVMFGLAGDDRLWGDDLDGSQSDTDIAYAGTGNDDLIGGVGTNYLYAWSDDPTAGGTHPSGPDYGVFTGDGQREETGLNRMLGRGGDDFLFAGTGLDFMYGGDGNDTLHDVNGEALEFGIGVPRSQEWVEYARSTDSVWYYGGSGADDVITVDYVTEPGVLGDHHLITRLTENNGLFTFDAQVQLDFAAVDEDGQRIWDPTDLVYQVDQLVAEEDGDLRRLAQRDLELSGGLLPAEGDYLAIIIDAKAGDDEVYVGPTVQRSVWVAAGDGDDRVEFAGGTALLVDQADSAQRNDVPGNADDPSRSFDLGTLTATTLFENLTLDSPGDVDWFELQLEGGAFGPTGEITVDSLADTDQIEIELFELELDGTLLAVGSGTTLSVNASDDLRKTARKSMPLGGFTLDDRFRYFVRIRSAVEIPTLYDLGINLGEGQGRVLGDIRVDLGNAPEDSFLRRDVIVGGAGNDVLQGGPSEDWVIGGSGNDLLTGGKDGGASDILIGEGGHDLFQVILDAPPSNALGTTFDLTLADQFEGGPGYDRVLIQGGDLDRFGNPVNDHITLSYNVPLGTTTVSALPWDIAGGRFLTNADGISPDEAKFQARQIEGTLIDLGDGDDELRLDDGYQFPGADPGVDPSHGIGPGHRQAGGAHLNFEIRGGDGNDRIFGSPYADVIDAGAGIDFVAGFGGDDSIRGGDGEDLLIGGGDRFTPLDRLETTTLGGSVGRNDAAALATPIDFSGGPVRGLTFHQGDAGDWYLVPRPSGGGNLTANDFTIDPDRDQGIHAFEQTWNEPLVTVTPAILEPNHGRYLPTFDADSADAFLMHVVNPRARAITAESPIAFAELTQSTTEFVAIKLDDDPGFFLLSVTVDGASSGDEVADLLNDKVEQFGLAGRVFFAFDHYLQRLVVSRRGSGRLELRYPGSQQTSVLGFTAGQTNAESASELGTYRIVPHLGFDPPSNPAPETYAGTIATPGVHFTPPVDSAVLAEVSGTTIDQVKRIEGDTTFDFMAFNSVVGDINGDGFDDLLVAGNTTAHVLLGPVGTTGVTAESIADVSDLTIDLDGGDNQYDWTPVAGGTDLNDDGLTEIAFVRATDDADVPTQNTPTIDVRVLGWTELAGGFAAVQQDGVLVTSMVATRTTPGHRIDAQWLEYDGVDGGDLLVHSRLPIARIGNQLAHGGVFAGDRLKQAYRDGVGAATNFESKVWIGGDLEPVADVATSLPGRVIDVSSTMDADLRSELQATKIDADGDGKDEVLLTRPLGWAFQSASERSDVTLVGRSYLLSADLTNQTMIRTGDGQSPAWAQWVRNIRTDGSFDGKPAEATVNANLAAIARDLNHDGIDEVIVAADGPTSLDGHDLLVFGNVTVGVGLAGVADSDVRIDNTSPDMAGLRGLGTGDFDGDHELDLVYSTVQGTTSKSVVIYHPLRHASGLIDLDARDLTVETESFTSLLPGDRLGTLARVAGDINGDGVDDLVLGAGGFDALASGVEINAGAVFVLPGQRRPGSISGQAAAIPLENFNVRGLGGALVDRENLVTFDRANASNPADFRLDVGTDQKKFRFRTLGDGRPGDVLRIGTGMGSQPFVVDRGTQFTYVPDDLYPHFGNLVQVGGERNFVGLIKFDLGKLMPALVDAQQLIGAELHLSGSATNSDTVVQMDLIVSELGGVYDEMQDVSVESVLQIGDFKFGKDPSNLVIDFDDLPRGLKTLQRLLSEGSRYVSLRLRTEDEESLVTLGKDDVALRLKQQPGAIATLADSEGRVLQANSAGFDLRNLPAGEYFLTVASGDAASQNEPIDFALTFNPPGLGAFDPASDDDRIDGGDGNDVVSGGPGRDAIWGRGGARFFHLGDLRTTRSRVGRTSA